MDVHLFLYGTCRSPLFPCCTLCMMWWWHLYLSLWHVLSFLNVHFGYPIGAWALPFCSLLLCSMCSYAWLHLPLAFLGCFHKSSMLLWCYVPYLDLPIHPHHQTPGPWGGRTLTELHTFQYKMARSLSLVHEVSILFDSHPACYSSQNQRPCLEY